MMNNPISDIYIMNNTYLLMIRYLSHIWYMMGSPDMYGWISWVSRSIINWFTWAIIVIFHEDVMVVCVYVVLTTKKVDLTV